MTDEEKELVLMLNDVYERFMELPEQHHSDKDEFVNALHVLQHLVMIRSVRRRHPDLFPLNLSAEAELRSLDDAESIGKSIEDALKKALGEKEDSKGENR